ncbi:uncharacterized protein LOC9639713 [Selaginella moellendorffii]|nr:uncharacterized protein LOC9639713 [Selaginella moellendorffii]|eukprot:XP_002986040.2 uncharacterized protein LOC9639713 [Selaginella moellendorffii]
MPGVMANTDNQGNVVPQRDPSPELQRQRGKCWGKFWCLGSSRKRGMRICPARQEGPASATNAWTNGASSSTAANQFVGLSPSLLAPPSSPASFANSGNPSTVQSPASFTVSLCVPAASSCSPAFDSTATMFTIGPYAHETTLVTPPAFSAFTTAPSTAPFTPPPELAHLTTPSSPDVPFAQLLTSLKNKGAVAGGAAPPYSASPFASPDYVSRGDMQPSYHLYPESPLTSLISPASGVSESGPPSPLPELEFPAAITAAKAAKATSVRLAVSLCDRRAVRLGHETPQSLDSNNHSRELEPIKILSPPRGQYEERWCSRTLDSCSTSSNAVAATKSMEELPRRSHSCGGIDEVELKRSLSQVGALPRGGDDDDRADADVDTMVVEDSQQPTSALLRGGDDDISDSLRDEEGRTEKNNDLGATAETTTHSRPIEEDGVGVCSSSSSSSCLDKSGDVEGEAKRFEEQALESPRSDCGIVLEVEITPDDLVKVNITGAKNKKKNGIVTKKNGFHHHHHHHHNHRNGFVASSKSSWEDLDAMSVDCMELNLTDNTIKSPLKSSPIMDSC